MRGYDKNVIFFEICEVGRKYVFFGLEYLGSQTIARKYLICSFGCKSYRKTMLD